MVFPLVVVLVAGGVIAAVVLAGGKDSSGGGKGDANGAGGAGGESTKGAQCGNYCVGNAVYLNACRLLPPAQAGMFGSMGGKSAEVDETYADPLPVPTDGKAPVWSYGLLSDCSVRPVDPDAALDEVQLRVDQFSNRTDATLDADPGQPLAGASGARKEVEEGSVEVHWAHSNATFDLTVSWDSQHGQQVSDSTLVRAYSQINAAVDRPMSQPLPVPPRNRGGSPVVTDACAVFSGADFQKTVGFVVDPTNVERRYSLPPGDPDRGDATSCRRLSAREGRGVPQPPGATYFDGPPMMMEVEIRPFADAKEAAGALDFDRGSITQTAPVPGVGQGAVFGVFGSKSYTVEFVKGNQLVAIRDALSVGRVNTAQPDEQTKLGALAHAIDAHM